MIRRVFSWIVCKVDPWRCKRCLRRMRHIRESDLTQEQVKMHNRAGTMLMLMFSGHICDYCPKDGTATMVM